MKLFDYQEDLVNKMVSNLDNYGCCVNFSSMGLGKSAMSINLMLEHPVENTLLVVPASIINSWVIELNKFANFKIHIYSRHSRIRHLEDADIVIASYDLLYLRKTKDSEAALQSTIHDIYFDRIFMDENQLVKNSSAKRYQSACLLKGDQKILLSGTPISANSDASTKKELNNYCALLGIDSETFKQIYLRKTVEDISDDMPKVIYKNKEIIISDEHADFITQLTSRAEDNNNNNWIEYIRDRFINCGIPEQEFNNLIFNSNGLVRFNRSRYLLSSPNMFIDYLNKHLITLNPDILEMEKIQRFDTNHLNKLNNLKRIIKRGNKYLIICNFIDELDMVYDMLYSAGYNIAKIDGRVSADDRTNIIKSSRFNINELFGGNTKLSALPFDIQERIYKNHLQVDIIVANLATVCVGLNFEHFDNLIMYSLPSSYINYTQAMARIVRKSSKFEKVNIYNMFYKDTIEEDILIKHNAKTERYRNLDNIIADFG